MILTKHTQNDSSVIQLQPCNDVLEKKEVSTLNSVIKDEKIDIPIKPKDFFDCSTCKVEQK